MRILAAILVLALTRAELIQRLKSPVVTKCDGLVQVYADCDEAVRREYQAPVADFVTEICEKLYRGEKLRRRRFTDAGVIVHLGDSREAVTNVTAEAKERANGTKFTRIRLANPKTADLAALRSETVKAFVLAVEGMTIDDRTAHAKFRAADPFTRAKDAYAAIAAWRCGEYLEGDDDEYYLKLARSVLVPGEVTEADMVNFQSRLLLYPTAYDVPFCGKYDSLGFREAVEHAGDDVRIRFAALVKSKQVLIFGAGRSLAMAEAAEAYSKFLEALARHQLKDHELLAMLDGAEEKLKGVLK